MVADQSGLPDLEVVVVLETLLGLEGQHHRCGQAIGELEHLLPGLPSPLADQQGHLVRLVEQRGGLLDGVRCRHRAWPRLHESRHGGALRQVEPTDVTRQGQHRDARLLDRRVGRLLDQQRQLVDAVHGAAEHGDVGEEAVVVDLLEELAADLLPGHLSADGEDGSMRLLGVVQAVEEVDGAWTDRAHADRQPAGELCLGTGREGTGLLVAYADPLDPVLAPDRVRHRVERVTDHAPHAGDAVVGERLDQQFGNGGHVFSFGSVTQGMKRSGSASAQSRSHCPGGGLDSSSPGFRWWNISA